MKTVIFLHPDLGIGGAERLVIDAALALKSQNYDVQFVTSHHDPTHSFPETTNGDLQVTVVGDWLPRRVFGRCYALCAYFRMIIAAFWLCFKFKPDILFCDQISACIPFIRLIRPSTKIIFYCHFPDLRLTKRETLAKSLYRWPLDKLEEWSTGLAHCVLVNSNFTAGILRKTFKSLESVKLKVLYPSLHTKFFDSEATQEENFWPRERDIVFLSINRYERKKNIGLAIEAFDQLRALVSSDQWERCHLVIAGGYDPLLKENQEHFTELRYAAEKLNLTDRVTFLKSPSDETKLYLLRSCLSLVYTPSEEHFGIVPIEAMYCRAPVIAANSGGPKETVVNNQTGYLVNAEPQYFAEAMGNFVKNPEEAKLFGETGRKIVTERFSFDQFTDQLCGICSDLILYE